MALTKFKYVPSKDTGVNADKQRVLYNIVFPAGKAVEVPDELVHKLRTKNEFVEVSGSIEPNEVELQKERDEKLLAKSKAKDAKLSDEEIEELKAVKAREDARIAQIQADAKAGR
jgi:hypothetical protein